MKLRSILLLATLAVVLWPALAYAEPTASDKAAMATQLYDDAQKLMDGADYANACPKFRESQRLDPQLGTQLHLADCYEKAGKTASAWATFREAAEIAAKRGDARESVARKRVVALEKSLARLTVTVPGATLPGLEVRLDDNVLGQPMWGAASPIDPGAHKIVVSADGREDRSYDVTIAAGDQKTITLEPGKAVEEAPVAAPVVTPVEAPAPPPQLAASSAPAPADRGTRAGKPAGGYVLLGVGVVGVAVGAVTGVMVLGKKSTIDSHCDDSKACDPEGLDAADSARTLSTVSTVGFVVGAIGIGAGAVLLLSGGDSGAPRTALSTKVLPGGGGLSLVREF